MDYKRKILIAFLIILSVLIWIYNFSMIFESSDIQNIADSSTVFNLNTISKDVHEPLSLNAFSGQQRDPFQTSMSNMVSNTEKNIQKPEPVKNESHPDFQVLGFIAETLLININNEMHILSLNEKEEDIKLIMLTEKMAIIKINNHEYEVTIP